MRLYRVINALEKCSIEHGTMKPYGEGTNANSFDYDKRGECFHFFANVELLSMYKNKVLNDYYSFLEDKSKLSKSFLFLIIEVDENLANQYKGYGKYIVDGKELYTVEYAIPMAYITKDMIVDIVYDVNSEWFNKELYKKNNEEANLNKKLIKYHTRKF